MKFSRWLLKLKVLGRMQNLMIAGAVFAAVSVTSSAFSVTASAQELILKPEDVAEKKVYSPYAGRAYTSGVEV